MSASDPKATRYITDEKGEASTKPLDFGSDP